MKVYVYEYVCMCAHISIPCDPLTCVHIHTYIYTVHACVRTYICTYIHMQVMVLTPDTDRPKVCRYIHTYTYYIYIYIYIIHIHTYMHTHRHTHSHIRMQVMVLTPDVDRQKVTDGKPSKQLVHKIAQETALLKEMRKPVVARYAKATLVCLCVMWCCERRLSLLGEASGSKVRSCDLCVCLCVYL
jgi:hypothetical protein